MDSIEFENSFSALTASLYQFLGYSICILYISNMKSKNVITKMSLSYSTIFYLCQILTWLLIYVLFCLHLMNLMTTMFIFSFCLKNEIREA